MSNSEPNSPYLRAFFCGRENDLQPDLPIVQLSEQAEPLEQLQQIHLDDTAAQCDCDCDC